jgi:uncharacterized membrane protein YkvA (DUF1232 family)
MSQQNSSGATQNGALGGLINEMVTAARLAFDGRVPFHLKLMLPIAALVYWIWPIDLMPGLPFDDVAVLILALHFFVQMANQVLDGKQGVTTPQGAASSDGNVVDTTWRRIE